MEPTRRANVCIGRRRNTARRARTGKLREERPRAVAISVRCGNNPDQRDLEISDIPRGDVNIIALTVRPIRILNGKRGTRCPRE